MSAFDQVHAYIDRVDRRLRWRAWTTGLAAIALAAAGVTAGSALYASWQAFSPASVRFMRFVLFLAIAAAAVFGVLLPLIRHNRRRAIALVEAAWPEFNQRLATFARPAENDPFYELLAEETLEVAGHASPSRVVQRRVLFACSVLALAGFGVLGWLLTSAPGALGYGSSLLWLGAPRTGPGGASMLELRVSPGDRRVRRNSDQTVRAEAVGFQPETARLYARYESAGKWEQAPMQRQPAGGSYEFVFAGLREAVDYYVEGGGVRSKTYRFAVVDLPGVQKIRVSYTYPKWTGLPVATEDPGGDLRAVEGTEAALEVITDRPLANGVLIFEDGQQMPLENGRARVRIDKPGTYHVAAMDEGQPVRLTDDYFIEAQQENPPEVRIARPGRDAKVSPIEEVTVAVTAEDDFGLQGVTLHYAVNGGAERTMALAGRGRKAGGEVTLALEEFGLAPGDLVSMYATARDARTSAKSDIVFLEAQPYEREYSQSQTMGGGGGGGGGEDGQITQRQKEIIAATFNQMRDRSADRAKRAENAEYLHGVQSKLRDQARTLAQRMRSRMLSQTNQEFQSFAKDMEAAAAAMGEAAGRLRTGAWQSALPAEQKALQHLLRAEATRRQIQVAFGRNGGEGGGGGQQRDLENLFDLELDTEKNLYETGRQQASEQNTDESLQRLEQLARRQQELAEQAKQQSAAQQKWQQEMLRREAEKLRQQMQQMAREGRSGGAGSQAMNRAVEQLTRATEEMRRGSPGEAGRAADRMREAADQLRGLRREQSGSSLDNLAQRAQQLAEQQKQFAGRAKQPGQTGEGLSRDKQRIANEIGALERDMQKTARDLAGTQRSASNKVREALGDMQGDELQTRSKLLAEWYRRGLGQYVGAREQAVTAGLERLSEQMRQAQAALGPGQDGKQQGMQQALERVEKMREQLARAGQPGGRQQGGQPGQQAGGQQPGQQPGPSRQPQGGQTAGGGARGGDSPEGVRDYYQPQTVPSQGSADGRSAVAQAMRELSEIRSGAGENADVRKQVEEIMRRMQRYATGDPRVLAQMRSELIPQLEQLEARIRRKLEEQSGGGAARTATRQQVPEGWRDAVAEYYRRLSSAK